MERSSPHLRLEPGPLCGYLRQYHLIIALVAAKASGTDLQRRQEAAAQRTCERNELAERDPPVRAAAAAAAPGLLADATDATPDPMRLKKAYEYRDSHLWLSPPLLLESCLCHSRMRGGAPGR